MVSTRQQILQEPDPFGAKVLDDGRTRFRIWMPSQDKVRPDGAGNPRIYLADTDERLEMDQCGGGWYEAFTDKAPHDARYKVEYWNHYDASWSSAPDFASRRQATTADGYSVVVDPARLTRGNEPADWGTKRGANRVIYEAHIGTFSKEGTISGVTPHLDYLQALGVTHLEVMPVAAFGYKNGWGYDGVLPGALHPAYGTPQDLADLSSELHARGMGLILDVVYNHIGPYSNSLWMSVPQFLRFADLEHIEERSPGFARLPQRGEEDTDQTFAGKMAQYHASNDRKTEIDANGQEIANSWGVPINLRQPEVRKYFEQIDRQWQETYHLDGMRRDAVHALVDEQYDLDPSQTHFVSALYQQNQASASAHGRDFFVVLESEHNIPSKLDPDNKGTPSTRGNAQWSDDFHHALFALLNPKRGYTDRGYYKPYSQDPRAVLSEVMQRGFALALDTPRNHGQAAAERDTVMDPRRSVVAMQNHDQVGNRPTGDPLPMTLDGEDFREEKLRMMATILLLSPFTPMLWQGQERSLKTIFPFFADLENPGERQGLIDGRKKELEQYADLEFIDPTALSTIERAKIPWTADAHDDPTFKLYQSLIRERAEKIGPHLASGVADVRVEPVGERGLTVAYTFGDGARSELAMNFGDAPLGLAPDWETSSDTSLTTIAGAAFQGQVLRPWSVAVRHQPAATMAPAAQPAPALS